MVHTFQVTIDADDLSAKELAKIENTLQKSLKKWFLKGYAIKVEQA